MNNFFQFLMEILYKFEEREREREREREFEKKINCNCEGALFSFHVIKYL